MTTRDQTTNAKTNPNPDAPKFIAYHVGERGYGKTKRKVWHRIGAAFDHEDGKGFTVQLDLMPIEGFAEGRIVLREPKEDEESAGAPEDAPAAPAEAQAA